MDQRPTWLVANWKMHGTPATAAEYAFAVNTALEMAPPSLTCIFCPPHPLIAAAHSGLPQNARLELGAQNCHEVAEGAFTGEVSAPMLKALGCGYVILGHSERRAMGETDALVQEKAQTAMASGLTPIICIGETKSERKAGKTADVLAKQMKLLSGLGGGRTIIAYEPVWAIGAGETPTAAEIGAAHRTIKTALGSETSVLYGGSVKSANLREILGAGGVDGVLIGGASRTIAEMKSMIGIVTELKG